MEIFLLQYLQFLWEMYYASLQLHSPFRAFRYFTPSLSYLPGGKQILRILAFSAFGQWCPLSSMHWLHTRWSGTSSFKPFVLSNSLMALASHSQPWTNIMMASSHQGALWTEENVTGKELLWQISAAKTMTLHPSFGIQLQNLRSCFLGKCVS